MSLHPSFAADHSLPTNPPNLTPGPKLPPRHGVCFEISCFCLKIQAGL